MNLIICYALWCFLFTCCIYILHYLCLFYTLYKLLLKFTRTFYISKGRRLSLPYPQQMWAKPKAAKTPEGSTLPRPLPYPSELGRVHGLKRRKLFFSTLLPGPECVTSRPELPGNLRRYYLNIGQIHVLIYLAVKFIS